MPNTQAPAAPKGQEYGEAGTQISNQQIQPIAGAPGGAGRPRTSVSGGQQQMAGMEPGQIPSLSDPSVAPNEPITAGLPMGPGPGPEALNIASFGSEELSVLRGIMLKFPNEDLRRQIQWTEQNLA